MSGREGSCICVCVLVGAFVMHKRVKMKESKSETSALLF